MRQRADAMTAAVTGQAKGCRVNGTHLAELEELEILGQCCSKWPSCPHPRHGAGLCMHARTLRTSGQTQEHSIGT